MVADTLRQHNRTSLAAIPPAERNDLPEEAKTKVIKFGTITEHRLAKILTRQTPNTPQTQNQTTFAAVAGAQRIAHGQHNVPLYEHRITTYRSTGLI